MKAGTGWFNKDSPSYIEGFVTEKGWIANVAHVIGCHCRKKIRRLYGDWTEFMASCSMAEYDQHFSGWLREHRDKRRHEKQQQALAAGGNAAPGHSPPANRRFSTTITNDADVSASTTMTVRTLRVIGAIASIIHGGRVSVCPS